MSSTAISEELQLRRDLAAAYRLAALFGWDDTLYTHFSVRLPGDGEPRFLINPFGLFFEEIRASDLIVVDMHGKVVDGNADYNIAGFTIHSAVHEARPDAGCVIHLHTTAGVAVSAQEDGLLPISQTALFPLAQISYHDYEGVALNPEEKQRLVAHLGRSNVMLLRNHGTLALGPTVADAFLNIYTLERACAMQIAAQAGGGRLQHVPQPIVDGIMAQAKQVTRGLGGALAWPALLRKLDRIDPSFRN